MGLFFLTVQRVLEDQKGISVEQVEEYLMSIKIERELSDALKLAKANSTTVKILSVDLLNSHPVKSGSRDCLLTIASLAQDANTWFIEVILRANGLQDTVAAVCSNPGAESET